MREQEAADLDAGRIRLADLDSDEEYGGKRGRKKKGKRKKNKQVYSSSEEEFDCGQTEGIADSTTNSVDDPNDNNDNDANLPDANDTDNNDAL